MVIRRLPAELADVVRRAAHYPHGLGFLHQAWVDSVAVTLGVHPFAVDATRAYLDTPGGRAELIRPAKAARLRGAGPGLDRSRARGPPGAGLPDGR